jgi:hypothetical protein
MTVEEAMKIDKDTNTSHWRKAIQKEMTNNRKAFQFLEENEQVPIVHKWIHCHMIFDVKMDFTRKARFVTGGHMTIPPRQHIWQILCTYWDISRASLTPMFGSAQQEKRTVLNTANMYWSMLMTY